jgi:hypothetical protein
MAKKTTKRACVRIGFSFGIKTKQQPYQQGQCHGVDKYEESKGA